MDGAKPSCVLHWDGRLDNRNDLLALLADLLRDDTSNSAIALAAYERWGTDGFVHLIGDWSVVIRDHANRATVLASDFAGVRPLYYSVQREDVFWSSRLQSVVDATGISELDEHYIGAFLLYGGCPNRTPYKGIYSVPAGHAVCVSSTGTKISRFWNLPIEMRFVTETSIDMKSIFAHYFVRLCPFVCKRRRPFSRNSVAVLIPRRSFRWRTI